MFPFHTYVAQVANSNLIKRISPERERHGEEYSYLDAWFIRHGESEAHQGLGATCAKEIRLSQQGREQAREKRDVLPRKPEWIVSSPYLRAQETAEPVLELFSTATFEIWNVQEFHYLGSFTGVYSTKQQRSEPANNYWKKCDPDFREDHEDSESFRQFIRRAIAVLNQLDKKRGFGVVYAHEQLMRAIQCVYHGWIDDTVDAEQMRLFRQILLTSPMSFCATLGIRDGRTQELWPGSYRSDEAIKALKNYRQQRAKAVNRKILSEKISSPLRLFLQNSLANEISHPIHI